MNKTKRHLLSLVLVTLLLAIPTIMVFAKELGSLTISGPSIAGEMTIDHEGGMMKLERTGFFDQSLSIKPPEKLGEGYNITAYLNLDGKVVPFVQMVYYAADKHQPGYVHYTARLVGESLKPVDQWRHLNRDADIAFRGLMEEYEITLQPAFEVAISSAPAVKSAIESAPVVANPAAAQEMESAASVPVAAPVAPALANQVILGLAVVIFVLLGAGLIIKRRMLSQQSPQM